MIPFGAAHTYYSLFRGYPSPDVQDRPVHIFWRNKGYCHVKENSLVGC